MQWADWLRGHGHCPNEQPCPLCPDGKLKLSRRERDKRARHVFNSTENMPWRLRCNHHGCEASPLPASGNFFSYYNDIGTTVIMVYQLCAGYSPQLIRNELGVPNSKRQTDMIRSLGQTAGYWLEVIFACSVGKCDTVIVDEAAIGKRKDQRGSRVRQGGTEWYMSVVHFDATNRSWLV